MIPVVPPPHEDDHKSEGRLNYGRGPLKGKYAKNSARVHNTGRRGRISREKISAEKKLRKHSGKTTKLKSSHAKVTQKPWEWCFFRQKVKLKSKIGAKEALAM